MVTGCNLDRMSAPSCPHCGEPRPESKPDAYDAVFLMERATCDDVDETSNGTDPHGPRFSHWFCSTCERYLTLERVVGSDTIKWVGS